jgi:hypothetical protein
MIDCPLTEAEVVAGRIWDEINLKLKT